MKRTIQSNQIEQGLAFGSQNSSFWRTTQSDSITYVFYNELREWLGKGLCRTRVEEFKTLFSASERFTFEVVSHRIVKSSKRLERSSFLARDHARDLVKDAEASTKIRL